MIKPFPFLLSPLSLLNLRHIQRPILAGLEGYFTSLYWEAMKDDNGGGGSTDSEKREHSQMLSMS